MASKAETGFVELLKLSHTGEVRLIEPKEVVPWREILVTSGSSPVGNLRAVEVVDTVWQGLHLRRQGVESPMKVEVGDAGSLRVAILPELASADLIGLDKEGFVSALTSRVHPDSLEQARQRYAIKGDAVSDLLLLPIGNFAAPTPDMGRYIQDLWARQMFEQAAETAGAEARFIDFSINLRGAAIRHFAAVLGLSDLKVAVGTDADFVGQSLRFSELGSQVGEKRAVVSFHCVDCGHMNNGEVIKHFAFSDGTIWRQNQKRMRCRGANYFMYSVLKDNPLVRDVLSEGAFLSGLSYYLALSETSDSRVIQLRDYSEGRGTYFRAFTARESREPIEVLPTRRVYLGKNGESREGQLSVLALSEISRRIDLDKLVSVSPFIEDEDSDRSEVVLEI